MLVLEQVDSPVVNALTAKDEELGSLALHHHKSADVLQVLGHDAVTLVVGLLTFVGPEIQVFVVKLGG